MPRPYTVNESSVLCSKDFKVYYQSCLGSATPIGQLGGDPTYDPFISGSIECNIQNPCWTGSFVFHLGKGPKSLSPYLSNGLKNDSDGGPALRVGEQIVFRTAATLPVEFPDTGYRTVFQGYIDDFDIDPGQDTVTVVGRDIFGQLLQDYWIRNISPTEDGDQYGFPVPVFDSVEQAMQSIINQSGAQAVIITEGTPGLALSEFWQEQMSVMDAIRKIGVTTNGWDLRGRWDRQIQDEFRLVYSSPVRYINVGGFTNPIGPGDTNAYPKYFSVKARSSILNVRNSGDVIPADDIRKPERVEDLVSQGRYGIRHFTLSEDLSSHIDTPTEAQTLAGIMIADLAYPQTEVEVEMTYFWPWEIGDIVDIQPDNFFCDSPILISLTGIKHTFGEDGAASTTISGSSVGRSAVRDWLGGRKRMNQIKLTEPSGPGREGDVWFMPDDLDLPTVS